MIPFSKPYIPVKSFQYIKEALSSGRFSGDCSFTLKCHKWLENKFDVNKALLTTSGTHALEMAALIAGIRPGDEIIMPSFTFPSTANAFVLRGAKIKFVDIRPDTMNIDENSIEESITSRTKAIVPVHYAGVSCEMSEIMHLAQKYDLMVIEDAAQAFYATYKGKLLGTFGDFATYSFHETKNLTSGEGGALMITDPRYSLKAEIIREKGTNRSQFFRGEVDKYTWLDIGSSYLPSDLNAAVLYAQLEIAEKITLDRLTTWNMYYHKLKALQDAGKVVLPFVPPDCEHNGHMFYIKVSNLDERTKLIKFLKAKDIFATFHYLPLHKSKAGGKFGKFSGVDNFTTKESERLLRLPLYYGITEDQVSFVSKKITGFFRR